MMHDRRGFTFIEILFAVAIVIPVLLGIIGVTVYSLRVTDSARMITTAVQDAHTVIERIRNISGNGLSQVTATYPSGQAVAGFNNLTAEQIVVTYPNAAADPLAVTVTVTWSDQNRNMSRSLWTQVTRR